MSNLEETARIVELLNHVDPEHFLGMSCNQVLEGEDLVGLSKVMPRLYNLTSLDLSCNVYGTMDTAMCWLLSETLAALPRLSRLDLGCNGMENKLRQLLENIQQPLEFLRISDCDLSEAHHATALQHLDISGNGFGRKIVAVIMLLKAVAPTLHVLEMQYCELEASDMDALLAFCPSLTRVRFLNIACNSQLRSARVIEHAKTIVQMAQLQAVQLSSPLASGSPQDDVLFIHRFTTRV